MFGRGAVLPALAVAVPAALIAAVRRRVSKNWIDLRQRQSGVVDLHGRVVVVTGGNAGLGYETSLDLCKRGATVVLGCRDAEGKKGSDAVESIRRKVAAAAAAERGKTKEEGEGEGGGKGKVECLELDLSSTESVRNFARTVSGRHPDGIYALICNAGVWVPMDRGQKTPDGKYEVHFGVNHLGHFLLVRSLLPHLRKSAGESRIIMVSSGLMKQGTLDMDKRDFVREGRKPIPEVAGPDGKAKKKKGPSFCPTGYADSKLMNALCCKRLAEKELVGSNVAAYAVCPGWCGTGLGRHVQMPWYKKAGVLPFTMMFQRSAVQGAQNIIFAAVEDKSNLKSGGFYRDGVIAEEETRYVESLGEELPQKLWDLSEELLKEE